MTHPQPDEYPPYTEPYVSRVLNRDPFALLRDQVPRLERLCREIADESARYRYAPGKWSVKEVIGHLTDTERVHAYRLLRIARGDRTPLPGFDQDTYVSAAFFDKRPMEALVREFKAVREATLSLIDTFDDGVWPREGTANNFRMTARALLFIIPGHVEHHFELLAERYGLVGLRG